MILNFQTFTGEFIHQKLCAIPLFRNACYETEYFEYSPNRFNMCHTNENGLILTVWITRDRDVILTRLELPEEERGKGLSVWIIRVLKHFASEQGKDLIVKYPDNRPFWYYYSNKYGGVKFQYR